MINPPPITTPPIPHPDPKPRFITQLRDAIRLKGYSLSTEKSYIQWARRYILFHDKSHPSELSQHHVSQFLAYLVNRKHVSPSTQNQALAALLFLYRQVLNKPDFYIDEVDWSKKPRQIPTVLTQQEVAELIRNIDPLVALPIKLMYGAGLRVSEAIRLRLGDIDFEHSQLLIRQAKGKKDRYTIFPTTLHEDVRQQIEKVRRVHQHDLRRGRGHASLPHALHRKYPGASRTLEWQFLFPSKNISPDPVSGNLARHHISRNTLQRAFRLAARQAGITKRITLHTLRHSFATHLLQHNYDIRTVQELLGHESVNTTMIYTHVLKLGGFAVKSPLDDLFSLAEGNSHALRHHQQTPTPSKWSIQLPGKK